MHAAQQRADHPRGAGRAARRVRSSCARSSTPRSTASTTRPTTAPPSTTPRRSASAFYEKMWNSPGFTKLTSNYTDLLSNPDANAEWCDVHRRQDPGHRRTIPTTADRLIPTDHRFGEKRPPFVTGYFEAFNRPERLAGRPAGDPDGPRHAERDRDDRRRAGVRHHRVGDRLRLRDRRPGPDGHPRS